MGRNQIDLLLLLTVLLIGSLIYNNSLKKQLLIIKGHCDKAFTQNKQSLELDKLKLLDLSESYPKYKEDINLGVAKLDQALARATFTSEFNSTSDLWYQELITLPPFSNFSLKDQKNPAAIYEAGINAGMNFLKQNDPSLSLEFSMFIGKIDPIDNKLQLEIKPFNRYKISSDLLYAVTKTDSSKQDSSKIEGPIYSYCGNLAKTDFVIQDYEGNQTPLNSLNQKKFRP